ncbi:MAG: gamma-glutamyl-phosphate reductase, partial [Clostridia bacterium]|nr:gamma-glutamyl-phosphate reductase [Clostridia bacterium]
MTTLEILQGAKSATRALSLLSTDEKNAALLAMAEALVADTDAILAANAEDIDGVKDTMNDVMIDRLRLTRERIASMADGIRDVVKLPDPVGKITENFTRPNGINVSKMRVPMGVVAIIYESRPNVTSDAAALALKS